MLRPAPLLACAALALAAGAAGTGEPGGGEGGELLPAQVLLGAEPPELVTELLEAGSLVLDRPGDTVSAYVVFDRPAARVYELLAATSRQREFRDELESVATVARTPEGPIDEHRIRIVFVELHYRLRYRLEPERRRIHWELAPGNAGPMRRVDGGWELYELAPDRTLARFATAVDVADILPGFVEEAITRRSLPRTLERCRLWVNADGGKP